MNRHPIFNFQLRTGQPPGKRFVRVKDAAGNEFICPLDALKDPKHATEEELANCVDDATAHRFPRDVEIQQS
jgi:hypothetical protein